jgi:hypothetical protein
MSPDAYDANYRKLLDSLDEAADLLRRHNEQFWADGLAADRARIAEGDRYALDHLLSAFGGMGSLNDVVPHGSSPSQPFDEVVRAANDRLSDLRDAIWHAAKDMQAELRRS